MKGSFLRTFDGQIFFCCKKKCRFSSDPTTGLTGGREYFLCKQKRLEGGKEGSQCNQKGKAEKGIAHAMSRKRNV